MIVEQTAEEVVTDLLSKNEVIITDNSVVKSLNNQLNLGEYLTNLSKDTIKDPVNEYSAQNTRYTFIKGKWIF